MAIPKESDFEWYIKNQEALVKKFSGRFLAIKDEQVLGDYGSEVEAVNETVKQGHLLGTFIVQRCSPGEDDYTAVYHSRAAFS